MRVSISPPPPTPEWTAPKLKLRVDDLAHEGTVVFFSAVQPGAVLRRAVDASIRWLYPPGKAPTHVEQVLLVLTPMEGVAHTSGTRTHKEIRLSLDYIYACRDRAEAEITGVLVHEMVHCFQHDAGGTCPGGLIEGIADYVRLNEGLAPPHWMQQEGNGWDSGYETTAQFSGR
ncbi:plant basic secretory protein [Pholiota conissans]|uniref:Plant basic secretory protein n=1 Tax=Pholiota conissans TaxID=109636 RepID=A0A9P5ZID5_9AGAR|nr:plant basic secretory protein [Pholiota conissans]